VGAMALSSMTVIPDPDAVSFHAFSMTVVAVFFPFWVSSAYRTRPQNSVQSGECRTKWLTRAWEAFGVLYSLAILVFVLG
jgi:hypothetical protein